MAFQPVVFADNLFNRRHYPSHTVTAEEEAVTDSKYWPGRGQRSSVRFWTATTLNSDTWLKVTCDRLRAANCVVIDRGHNLAGKTVRIDVSNDDFTTYESPVSVTLPSVTAPGDIDDARGVRTEEGAWVMRFPVRAGRYWRLFVPALGSGLAPQIVGLYLGLAWSPPVPPQDQAWDDDADEIGGARFETDAGWVGGPRRWNRRAGALALLLASEAQYDEARLWLHGFYGRGSPMWLVPDEEQAERALCVVRPNGVQGLPYTPDSVYVREGVIPWVEHEPKAS